VLKEDIGKTIRERRKSLRITQPDLAELAGISVNSLYKLERGESNPTVDLIEKIITVLGLEMKLEARKIVK
jgi:transcriptional regulator with XRE-family HTH domain